MQAIEVFLDLKAFSINWRMEEILFAVLHVDEGNKNLCFLKSRTAWYCSAHGHRTVRLNILCELSDKILSKVDLAAPNKWPHNCACNLHSVFLGFVKTILFSGFRNF